MPGVSLEEWELPENERLRDNWELLRAHEYAHRAALEEARHHVRAELARPHERNLSHLGVGVAASFAFGAITVILSTRGVGWWIFLPAGLLLSAVALTLRYTWTVLRPERDSEPVFPPDPDPGPRA
ncbi:hypothetical protein AB0M31_34390 [Streptomyces sp. NPDC051773]|uniref:hypothetical protein n=1 Tax=Streptomyces sp. NPDC051773 TaxID=3156682 RepID=UPI0034140175